MIENFRKIAKNPIMRVLLLVLVVSFMLSGLSAGFSSVSHTDNYIVKVADEKIYTSQIDAEYKNIARGFAERGLQVDDKMLADLGVSQEKILNELVQRKLVFAEVHEMGLTVSNDYLRKVIVNNPAFQVSGKFDADTFKRFLYIRGLREHQYLDELRKEISGEAMMQILFADVQTPARVFELLKNRAATKFYIEAALIPADYAELKETPTEPELKDFLFANSELFERPETRDISYVELKKIEDEKASHAMAVAIEDDIAGGATLEEIAKKHSGKVEKSQVTKETLSDISELAFGLDESEISEVKETEGKTYLIGQVDKITERHLPELAAIKDEVAKEWTIAEKQKISRQFAIDFYEESKEKGAFAPNKLKVQNFSNVSATEFAQKGLSKLRGITPAEAQEGAVFGLYENAEGGYLVTRLKDKKVATLSNKELENYKQVFQQAYATELQQSYLNYLAAKHGVEFNKEFEKK